MYHDKFVAGLEVWAIHIRSAVSPTWYCFLGVSMVGPSSGRSIKRDIKSSLKVENDLEQRRNFSIGSKNIRCLHIARKKKRKKNTKVGRF